MHVISGRNVNRCYSEAMSIIMWHMQNGKGDSVIRSYPSRNGPMLEFDTPVTTIYKNPRERVLFDPIRDANPFLHFFESLWMIAGRNDLSFLTRFTKNMANFSDDGETLNGAYGYRWRQHFPRDQIADLLVHLKEDPMSRRAVTQMWDVNTDFPCWSKDHPCNTHIYWKLRNGRLDMTVGNRSNDAIWGCYGANAVHFSMIQEYVACKLGVEVGVYYQVSNSLHIYPELDVTKRILAEGVSDIDLYEFEVDPGPLMITDQEDNFWFDLDLERFFNNLDDQGDVEYQTPYFKTVVSPLWNAFRAFKNKDAVNVILSLKSCAARDWARAADEWVGRRWA